MESELFLPKTYKNTLEKGSVCWQSPSNIALVKYWGKKPNQIPANPSISFTLSKCKTITTLEYSEKISEKQFDFKVYVDGKHKVDFEPKIKQFFERIEQYIPFLKAYSFRIETTNTFPHSSGIASSASGMSALALCLMSMENKLVNEGYSETEFYRKASFLSRLGSGSACRSIQGPVVEWGEHKDIKGSSDIYGIQYPFEINSIFKNFQDTILLIDKGKKQVSSSVGHQLLNNHPFAESRYRQANVNMSNLIEVFKKGDINAFIEIVESEALSLHAMMMTSIPYFILMKPNTLQIIEAVWNFRKKTGSHLCFTLDAGANVHLLYPKTELKQVLEFIDTELVQYCENGQYITDELGEGAIQVS